VEFLLPQLAERRPAAETLRDLRLSCDFVLASDGFADTFGDRVAELVPPDHLLRSAEIPVEELAVAVLDPVRDPERYGGSLDHVEARWQQLGAWVAALGMPDDTCHHLVRAVARAARDVSGEDWDSAASSGWAALQMWMQASLDAGVEQSHADAAAAPEAWYDQPSPRQGERQPDPQPDAEPEPHPDPRPDLRAVGQPEPPRRTSGRHGGDPLAAAWSDNAALDAMTLGGAPPAALRAMRRAMGDRS
jgi:hypothetical protein